MFEIFPFYMFHLKIYQLCEYISPSPLQAVMFYVGQLYMKLFNVSWFWSLLLVVFFLSMVCSSLYLHLSSLLGWLGGFSSSATRPPPSCLSTFFLLFILWVLISPFVMLSIDTDDCMVFLSTDGEIFDRSIVLC